MLVIQFRIGVYRLSRPADRIIASFSIKSSQSQIILTCFLKLCCYLSVYSLQALRSSSIFCKLTRIFPFEMLLNSAMEFFISSIFSAIIELSRIYSLCMEYSYKLAASCILNQQIKLYRQSQQYYANSSFFTAYPSIIRFSSLLIHLTAHLDLSSIFSLFSGHRLISMFLQLIIVYQSKTKQQQMHLLSKIHIYNLKSHQKMEAYLVLKIKENIHVTGISVISAEQISWNIDKNCSIAQTNNYQGIFQLEMWNYNAAALICSAKFRESEFSQLVVEGRDQSKDISIRLQFLQQTTKLSMELPSKTAKGKQTKRTDTTNRQSNNSILLPHQNTQILKSSASLLSCLSQRQLYRVREKNVDYAARTKEVSPTYYRYKRQQKY